MSDSEAMFLPSGVSKPRLKYSEVFRLDLDSLEWEQTKVYLDGEEYQYAGHHFAVFIWLKRKNQVQCFRQADVMSRLRLTK